VTIIDPENGEEQHGADFILSANAPEIRAGVMMANINW